MRRVLLAIALLLHAPNLALAQLFEIPNPMTFAGCDGDRSCHTATFAFYDASFTPPSGITNVRMGVRVNFVSQWLVRGGSMDSCSGGCAWSPNRDGLLGNFMNDMFHGSPNCWAANTLPGSAPLGLSHPCAAGTIDPWLSLLTAEPQWRPEYAALSLFYQPVPLGPVVTGSVRLTLVPEATTSVLTLTGLVMLAFAARRRRSR